MVYYVKYWITVRQENPDVKSFVFCGNSLSASYLVKINAVRGGADRPSLRFERLGCYNPEDCRDDLIIFVESAPDDLRPYIILQQ